MNDLRRNHPFQFGFVIMCISFTTTMFATRVWVWLT